MSNAHTIEIKINNRNKRDIFKSVIAETNPIVIQLQQFGYDKIYSRRVFYYLHPEDLEEALNYMAVENGIIQHTFVPDRNSSNNLCYICGDVQKNHLKNLDLNDNINQINNNEEFQEDQKDEDNNKDIYKKSENSSLNNGIFTNINKIKNSILSLNKRNVRQDKVNIENNLNTKNELISKEEGKIECEICNELFVPNDKNTVKNCGHSFCSSCWYDSLSVKIKENKLPSIKCLDYNCKEKLTEEFIINILNSDIDLIRRYKKYKLELEIINDPNKKLCPYPNCDSYLELKDILIKDVKCKNNHTYCFECLKKPHGNLPCNSNLYKSITEFAKNHFIKKCPKCGIIIEKNKGCNHITCIQCGYQWCWLCNQEYKPDHFSSGKCRGFQFYQPKNEYEIKLLMEGKINYNELSSSQRQLIELDNDANNNHPRHRPNHNNRAQRERNNRSIGDKIGEGIIAFFLILIYSPFLFFQPLFEWWIEIINSMHISYKGCMKFFIAFPCFCMTVIIFFPLRYFISFIILFCTMIICN